MAVSARADSHDIRIGDHALTRNGLDDLGSQVLPELLIVAGVGPVEGFGLMQSGRHGHGLRVDEVAADKLGRPRASASSIAVKLPLRIDDQVAGYADRGDQAGNELAGLCVRGELAIDLSCHRLEMP